MATHTQKTNLQVKRDGRGKPGKNYLKQLFVIRVTKDQNTRCFKSALFGKTVTTTNLKKGFFLTEDDMGCLVRQHLTVRAKTWRTLLVHAVLSALDV